MISCGVEPAALSYIISCVVQVCGLLHAPLSAVNKAAGVMEEDTLALLATTAWNLLL